MIDNYTYSVNTSYDNGQFTIVEKIGDGKNSYTFKGVGTTKAEAEKQVERQFKEALAKEINEAIAKTKKKPVEKPVEKKPSCESNSTLNKLKADYENLNKKYASLLDDYDEVCDELEKLQDAIDRTYTEVNVNAALEKYIQECIDSLIAYSKYFNAKE